MDLELFNRVTRRGFIGATGAAAAGLGLTGCATRPVINASTGHSNTGKTQTAPETSLVTITRGKDRRKQTYDSLKPYKDEVSKAIGNRNVVIKVNGGFPSEAHKIHSTYPDQVRGIIDFLREFYSGPISIAEGVGSSTTGSMMDAYELFGYNPILKEYKDIKFVDANLTTLETKYIHQFMEQPTPIRIIKMYFDPSNYIISAARFKTHNAVVATYSLKNIGQGSPVGQSPNTRNEKNKMHGGRGDGSGQELNYNLFTLALEGVYPDLAVVDGITGIEGDGPWDGTEVDHQFALASTDFVAADRICTELMKVDPFVMKYVEWCGLAGLGNWDPAKIKVQGATVADLAIQYKMNRNYNTQVAWLPKNYPNWTGAGTTTGTGTGTGAGAGQGAGAGAGRGAGAGAGQGAGAGAGQGAGAGAGRGAGAGAGTGTAR
jgi:uncharacterized protein (DUF362 family)